jgi:XTP/dITP diphosphohydrolase
VTQVVLATRNQHKLVELQRILDAAEVDVTLVGVDAFDHAPEVAETGLTFAANAILKALAVAEATQLPAVADDSGLCVDVLGGMPGIFSARWSGRHGDDRANLDLVLAQIADVSDVARGAHFACAAAFALPTGEVQVVEGEITGELIREPRGTNGFGYDPIFLPTGETRTTAQMSAQEKDAISHRGRAFRALAPHIDRMLRGDNHGNAHQHPPRLTDGVIVLRAATVADADAMTETLEDWDTAQWLLTIPHPYPPAASLDWIRDVDQQWRDGTASMFVIADAQTDAYLGEVGVRHFDRQTRRGELGYVLAPHARGRGVMQRALVLAIDWVFDNVGLDRIDWAADVGNDASWRVVERIGFQREGMRRERNLRLADNVRRDEWVGGLLRQDWEARRAPSSS